MFKKMLSDYAKENKKEYFNVYIDKDNDEEFLYLLEKAPYTNEKEIGELFSHLAYIDEVQKEKNAKDLKLCDKVIKFDFVYNDGEGAKVEKLQIPLGQGHFTKGINHLRKIGKQDWEKDLKNKNLDDILSKKYDKYLRKPPATEILQKGTLRTLQHCAKILDTVPSTELQNLLQGFMNGDEKCRIQLFSDNEKNKKKEKEKEAEKDIITEREKELDEFRAQVKNSIQKKSNSKELEKEISKTKNIALSR